MAYQMNEILPKLYLGNIVNSMDMRHLNEFNISHIISVYEKARTRFPERDYLLIKVFDRDNVNLIDYFSKANDFIHKARLKSQNVLVHCVKGISRSVTIVVAYIMSITNFGYQDALRIVQASRPSAEPNNGFMEQLEDFEKSGCHIERLRLNNSFDSKDLYILDEKFCALTLEKISFKCNDLAKEPDSAIASCADSVLFGDHAKENY